MIVKLIQPKMISRPMDTQIKIRMAPSLALLTIANIIPSAHTVIIENENIETIDFDLPVDLVGITVTVDTMPRAVAIAKEFRKRGVKVVAGGIHITACPEGAENYFDVVCIGMAERTWPKIVDDAARGKLKVIYTDSESIDPKDIAAPKYDTIDHSKYLYTNVISASRGCPFSCDFCYNSCKGFRNGYVTRTLADVIADIKAVKKRHIMFVDDNFIGNPDWTRAFLQAITPLNLKWNAAVSANIINMPEMLDLMQKSGCQSLFIGFESLNTSSINGVHKSQNNTAQYEKLVDEVHKRGIMINASFVFGLDGDDQSTFAATLAWIVKNKIETVTSHILTPYPGTKLYDELLAQQRITDFDLSHYNTAEVVFTPNGMSKDELYDGYIWMYKKIYTFNNIVKRMPKAKSQRLPYLAFNLFYRKFGKFTQVLCTLFSFNKIGVLGEYFAYRTK